MKIVQAVKKLSSISRARLNFRRWLILRATLYRNLMQVSNFGGTFDQLFLWIFLCAFSTEDACQLLRSMVRKSQKWPKTQIKGGVLPLALSWSFLNCFLHWLLFLQLFQQCVMHVFLTFTSKTCFSFSLGLLSCCRMGQGLRRCQRKEPVSDRPEKSRVWLRIGKQGAKARLSWRTQVSAGEHWPFGAGQLQPGKMDVSCHSVFKATVCRRSCTQSAISLAQWLLLLWEGKS